MIMIDQVDQEIADAIAHAELLDSEFDELDRKAHKSNSALNLIEVEDNGQACAVERPGWELFKITIDSGASETVCNDSDFGEVPTNPGIGSRNGVKYMSASGKHMANLGVA